MPPAITCKRSYVKAKEEAFATSKEELDSVIIKLHERIEELEVCDSNDSLIEIFIEAVLSCLVALPYSFMDFCVLVE